MNADAHGTLMIGWFVVLLVGCAAVGNIIFVLVWLFGRVAGRAVQPAAVPARKTSVFGILGMLFGGVILMGLALFSVVMPVWYIRSVPSVRDGIPAVAVSRYGFNGIEFDRSGRGRTVTRYTARRTNSGEWPLNQAFSTTETASSDAAISVGPNGVEVASSAGTIRVDTPVEGSGTASNVHMTNSVGDTIDVGTIASTETSTMSANGQTDRSIGGILSTDEAQPPEVPLATLFDGNAPEAPAAPAQVVDQVNPDQPSTEQRIADAVAATPAASEPAVPAVPAMPAAPAEPADAVGQHGAHVNETPSGVAMRLLGEIMQEADSAFQSSSGELNSALHEISGDLADVANDVSSDLRETIDDARRDFNQTRHDLQTELQAAKAEFESAIQNARAAKKEELSLRKRVQRLAEQLRAEARREAAKARELAKKARQHSATASSQQGAGALRPERHVIAIKLFGEAMNNKNPIKGSIPEVLAIRARNTQETEPEWVSDPSKVPANMFVVSGQRFATLDEAEGQLTDEVLLKLVEILSRETNVAIVTPGLADQYAVKQCVAQSFKKDFGAVAGTHEMFRVHALVESNEVFRHIASEAGRTEKVKRRIAGLSVIGGCAGFVLLAVAGFFNLNYRTGGRYRFRLLFASALLLAVPAIVLIMQSVH